MAQPISLEVLVVSGCSVNMDAGSFFLLQESASSPNLLLNFPDASAFAEVQGTPMLYANYLLHLDNVQSSIVLWVMLPDQMALEIFNSWCKMNQVSPDYWIGSEPVGEPWHAVEPHLFQSNRVIQLAWNRIQAYEKSRV